MKRSEEDQTPSELITARIAALGDWRGVTLGRVRQLIRDAVPDIVEEWKWRGVPVWSAAGILCTGETYRDVVKLTFSHGAALADPARLFNASLAGKVRRAIDIRAGDDLDEPALQALVRAAAIRNRSARTKPTPTAGSPPAEPAEPIYFAGPADFRAWLEANHSCSRVLLVGYHRKATGRPSLTWPESVDEALCFGWIDGVRRTVAADRFTVRFTPRQPGSVWSTVNVAKVQALVDQGRMQPAGLAAFERRQADRSRIYSHEQGDVALPEPYQAILRANLIAQDFFTRQPAGYRRAALWWVVSAKQEQTRRSRFDKLLACSTLAERLPQFSTNRPTKGDRAADPGESA